ncbi:universal stress protein [Calidifontibacter terrae]
MQKHIPSDAVVVGVDGSLESRGALRWAANRAEQAKRPLHVLHAEGAPIATYSPALKVAPNDNICAEAIGLVAQLKPELRVTWSEPAESPVLALIDASTVASELVLGTRGSGAVRGAVLGSVTVQVSTTAQCPVLVVRGPVTDRQVKGPVVVGVDLRPDSLAALDFAFGEADRRGVGLLVVLCWQLDRWDFASGIPMPGGDMAAVAQDHRTLLNEALAGPSGRYPGVAVTTHVKCAPTAATLVEQSSNASLLVVGTRGHREVAGLVLGSVSQSVMRRALCPVAVVAHTRTEDAKGDSGKTHTSV